MRFAGDPMRVPPVIQEQLAIVLAAAPSEDGFWPRVNTVFKRCERLAVFEGQAWSFDTLLDDLISRGYIETDDITVAASKHGHEWLLSLAEFAAAQAGYGRSSFDRLTNDGWRRFALLLENLPMRYGTRGGDYFVYVVLLHQDTTRLRRFTEANNTYAPGKASLYVGMSSRAPLQRFRHHLRGRKSSRYVRRHGLCLLPEFYAHMNPFDRYGAQAMEIDLAADLRRQGFGVLGVYESQQPLAGKSLHG